MSHPLSSRLEFPVNQHPKQEEERERLMTAGSGRKLLPLLENSNQLGASLKMFAAYLLLSEEWYSKNCSLRWKVSAISSNVLLFQLSPSVRHTDEIEYGLLDGRML